MFTKEITSYDQSIYEKIKYRKVIIFDTNIWIDLSENNKTLIQEVKQLLINLVKKEVIFCPISLPIIWNFISKIMNQLLEQGT